MNSKEKKIIRLLDEHEKTLKEHGKMLSRIEKLLTDKKEETSITSIIKSKSKSPKSISGFITRFSEEGFFDTPKTLKEISEELARQGYHYRTTSLTNPIQKLLRKRSIGRIVVNGKWAYVKR